MAALLDTPVLSPSIFTLGQRYLAHDHSTDAGSSEMILTAITRDQFGGLQVVMTDADNREISVFMQQFEAAMEMGIVELIG